MALSSDALNDFKRESLRGTPGYFRLGRTQAGQWWLLDGEDRPFVMKAVHGVAADADVTHDPSARMRSWGFNTLGCGSERLYLEDGLAFLGTVNFCAVGNPVNLGGVRLPDVFAAEWARQAEVRALEVCAPLSENRHLIGWVTDDRPGWASSPTENRPGLLQVCLSLEPGLAAYHSAWEFALALYGNQLDRMARAWGVTLANKETLRAMTRTDRGIASHGYLRDDEQWTREFARRYFDVAVAAIRKQAPNHLVLGCRWGGPVSPVLRAACAVAADVCFVDHTELVTTNPGPVLLGDFNWASPRFYGNAPARRGLGLTTLERMLRRGRLVLSRGIAQHHVVGYAWSRWHDRAGEQPPFGSGLVHLNETEAREHTELLTAINDRVEELRAMTLITEEIA